MENVPAPTCAQCGRRLGDVSGMLIFASAEEVTMNPKRAAEDYLRWFYQKCAHVVCDVCGSIRIPLVANILHDDGTTEHAAILPIGNRYCSNPACVHGMKAS